MKRRIFYSFDFKYDCWRTSQVRNIGTVEGNKILSDNDWESVKSKGPTAVENWIDAQLKGCSCTVVLVGERTANRKWVKKEIEKSWSLGKGVLGIRIHNLKSQAGKSSKLGPNPFSGLKHGGKSLFNVIELKNPPYTSSKTVYKYISENLNNWVEDAIKVRNNFGKEKSFLESILDW